jgi:hypothetical protein
MLIHPSTKQSPPYLLAALWMPLAWPSVLHWTNAGVAFRQKAPNPQLKS